MLPRIWDPFHEMEEMMRHLPALRKNSSVVPGFVPALDVYETKDAVMVETPLAGVKPQDVEVSVEKRVLTISGENKREHEVEEKNYYRKEVRSGSFYRQVALPAAVREEDVTAEFEDGILKITCPKAEPSKGKKIEVKVVKKASKQNRD